MTAATSATDEQAVRAALAEIDAGYVEGDRAGSWTRLRTTRG